MCEVSVYAKKFEFPLLRMCMLAVVSGWWVGGCELGFKFGGFVKMTAVFGEAAAWGASLLRE